LGKVRNACSYNIGNFKGKAVLEELCMSGKTTVKLLVLKLNGQCDLQQAVILTGTA